MARLLASDEPSVRLRTRVEILGQDPASWETMLLHADVCTSPRVQVLLSERDESGRIPHHPYTKWVGAHWVLVMLAEAGYPPGDDRLIPLRDQVYDWLLSREHTRSVRCIAGRWRRCASQEGNALWATLVLGLADERSEELAERLLKWQWPDGGWNCDRRPEAVHSSFMETLIPLRALALHARLTASAESWRATVRAAEIFLKRRLFRRQADGSVMREEFVALHYPCYWHYDILFGLKVMAEAGFIGDGRCEEALALLAAKRRPDGGFAAEGKYYRVSQRAGSGRSLVGWGSTGRQTNEFVTVQALSVFKAYERWMRRRGRTPQPRFVVDTA